MAGNSTRVVRRRLAIAGLATLVAGGVSPVRAEAADPEMVRIDALLEAAAEEPPQDASGFTVLLQDADSGRLEVQTFDALPDAGELIEDATEAGQDVVTVGIDHRVESFGSSYPAEYPADPAILYNRALADMDLNAVWPTTTGDGVVVAVLDTGVQTNHPDFAGRIVPGQEFLASRGTQGGIDGCTADTGYHGTHVAATIAGVRGNGIAGYGVAPGASIMPVCVLDGTTGYFSDVSSGIIWAADNGADIINMSLGAEIGGGTDPVMEAALAYAASRDVMVFAAAGNNGAGSNAPNYPGSSLQVITVGSVTFSQQDGSTLPNVRSSFSNYSPGVVELVATGSSVGAAVPYSYDTRGWAALSGTSMATPMAAGAAALVRAALPSYNAQQVRDLLYTTAQDLGVAGRDDLYGLGRIRPDLALAAVEVDPTPPPVVSGSLLTMVPSFRVVDTRVNRALVAGEMIEVSMAVPIHASAVSGNVTAVGTGAPGYLTVYAPSAGASCAATPIPNTSTVNHAGANDVRAAAGIFPVDRARVCILTSAAAHVLLDVSGYLAGDNAGASVAGAGGAGLVPIAPNRVADTRSGPMIGGATTLEVELDAGGVEAVQLNVTAVNPIASTFLTIWPKTTSCSADQRPPVSSLNVGRGEVRPNTAIVDASTDVICIYSELPTHVLVDHVASFSTSSMVAFSAVAPTRALDTRRVQRLAASSSTSVPISASGGEVVAVQGNITALDGSGAGYVTSYACGAAIPATSNVNFKPGEVSPNGGVLPVGGGALCLYVSTEANVLADISGLWLAPS